MESSVDSYLHKKFKKQLSVEARPQINDKEIKNAIRIVESSKEKRENYVEEYNEVIDNQTRSDNKESVPNLSTNENGLYVLNATKSSISVENCLNNLQSAKSCISYVSQNRQNSFEQYKYISFDTKFNSIEPSNSIVSTSSIIDSSYLYPKADYVALTKFEELPPCISAIERNQFNEEKVEKKLRENSIPPEKNSGGKHVCTYCNLACSKPSVLQKHIRAHTNERPYPCISCGFSFKTRSNLYKHCRSRTHANRVMGNKAQEINNEMEVEPSCNDNKSPHNENSYRGIIDRQEDDYKSKLYKPRFHISRKVIHEPTLKENFHAETTGELQNTNILSHHINELINKNNSILHCQAHLLKKRTSDLVTGNLNNNDYDDANQLIGYESCTKSDPKSAEEPLNLTNKNRKRSISEAIGPTQKSLIKELLLKNLASDMQCPHCKMIFQTVTELELHKLKSCRGFVKPGAKYTRSSSVNVASILTQNKNAFDSMPQMENASFPLESPGPFLGKTRLVETDKSKSFSFDDGLSTFSAYCKSNDSSQRYLLSPLTLHYERERKIPVKLFGGEVKITHNSGETKSFKIDYKGDAFNSESNYINYGGRLSENHVVKSSLQSGGIVLTNKTNYNKQDSTSGNQDVIRVYENTSVSPSIDITNLGKSAFTFEGHIESQLSAQRTKPQDLIIRPADDVGNTPSPSHTYTNIIDFSQNAVKLLTPNLKQPNLMVPGLPIPNKFDYSYTNEDKQCVSEQHLNIEINSDCNNPQNMNKTDAKLKNFQENLKVPHTLALIPPESTSNGSQQLSNLYNPMNIMVNGKVVRYVPGIPGPIDAESPDIEYMRSNTILSANNRKVSSTQEPKLQSPGNNKLPTPEKLEIKTNIPLETLERKSPKQQIIKSPMKSGEIKSTSKITTTEIKRFIRPNSLALKPTTASLKQHHGLTPTMFNQILISPDTPRVAKKYVQQFLNGNYFSYLGLKSTTKPVYCTLNKTQPFYVPHFKKLSMYSEWRQQDTKADKLYVSAYDSRQKCPKFTIASQKGSFLVAHSSYKFITSESRTLKENKQDDHHKNSSILGGYECNEDYTYVRGRGRGRYVCEQCGIRCKKPSMLKKHIRTHSNDRPYTCSHCNFSFKTKGNLTKHMKSKAHTKNYTASNSSSSSTQQSGTQSSDSETEDSGMDSSDESTRQQEHEAAYGLLSLSQKSTHNIATFTHTDIVTTSPLADNIDSCRRDASISFMNTEEIAFVSKSNFAKNKILEQPSGMKIDNMNGISIYAPLDNTFPEANKLLQYLGGSRPLTYPYTSDLPCEGSKSPSSENKDNYLRYESSSSDNDMEPKCIKRFHVIQKYTANLIGPDSPPRTSIEGTNQDERRVRDTCLSEKQIDNSTATAYERTTMILARDSKLPQFTLVDILPPILKLNDTIISDTDLRKRKFPIDVNNYPKIHKNDEVMDLSIAGSNKNSDQLSIIEYKPNGSSNRAIAVIEELASIHNVTDEIVCDKTYGIGDNLLYESMKETNVSENNFNLKKEMGYKNNECSKEIMKTNDTVLCPPAQVEADNRIHVNGGIQEQALVNTSGSPFSSTEYDNSAMQTLAEIATKQVKLEKNTLAKSVASEYLKLATKNEYSQGERRNDRNNFTPLNKEVDELIVKTEGNKTCTVCSKTFSKPSQLRLHMNIHYIERPFRCDSCSVSFRTKGHLQKHERSASHHNKLSTSPALSSSEPRPFKCLDCNIAFRIHGHLAKHLRSKMHILRLECLAKVPFGLYAELERSNSLLTEINTADGDQCLESLKTLAKKVFLNDADKMKRTSQPSESIETGY